MWLFALIGVFSIFMVYWMFGWYKDQLVNNTRLRKKIVGQDRPLGMFLLLLTVILRSWVQIGVAGFLPFYLQQQGMTLHKADMYVFLFLGAGALATYIGGRVSDRISRKSVVLYSLIASIPFALLLPHVTGMALTVTLFLFGFTILSSFAVTVVYGQMLIPSKISMASGLMIGFGVGAGGVGATLFGKISDLYGVNIVMNTFVFLIVVASIISAFIPNDKQLKA